MQLLVNIDHIATLRNARGEGAPDVVEAARICEESGAAGIVFHLREDRRHIKDADVFALKNSVRGILDFEMAGTPEMVDICCEIHPHIITLVPEKRAELTTEGGLNMKSVYDFYKKSVIPPLLELDSEISLFVDPVEEDIRLAAEIGAHAIELHTGTFANSKNPQKELDKLAKGAELAHSLGLKINAGHGLNFENISLFIQTVPHLSDISIGHALISHAVFHGLPHSVRSMSNLISSFNTTP